MNPVPRLKPEIPLPPYAYIPSSLLPHPTSHPLGHQYGSEIQAPTFFDAGQWRNCIPFLLGIDLFNNGYYWEAHESWEMLWRCTWRGSDAAKFLKALIKLSAAGVKLREVLPAGVRSHAGRAKELLQELSGRHGRYMGLELSALTALADRFLEAATALEIDSAPAERYFWMFPAMEEGQ